MNIFMSKIETKMNTVPFSKIETEHYKPAFIAKIMVAKCLANQIANSKDPPTFQNTIEALNESSDLDLISSVFFNLNSTNTSDEMQAIAEEISPLLSELGNDIALNSKLFERVQKVYNSRNSLNLTVEELTLLEDTFKSFTHNGALLNETDKETLRSIDNELSTLGLKFSKNVLADTNSYFLHITNESDLDGLPDNAKQMAASTAKSKNLDGWVFTLSPSSFISFVTHVKNRDLRKQITIAMGKKGFQNNTNDNQEIVKSIVDLRHKRAKLFGYDSYSAFVLDGRMAKTPENVHHFLNDLLIKAKPAAQKEMLQLSSFAKDMDGIETLERWDVAYYSNALKQKLFNFDDELLKPYFQLENVLDGAFTVANKLYDITFKEIFDIDKYHDEVKTFEVLDSNNDMLGILYCDFFPRKEKENGAWMTSFKRQFIKDGINHRPHISIVCNFTPKTETTPSLLTFNEVKTLFHEFGHALHGILSNVKYNSLSCTSVVRDFVELPSQVMENWCYEPEALKIFAKHYVTGDVIPQDYIEKIKESQNFQQGMATLRQLSFAMLDIAYHSKHQEISDVKAFEVDAIKETILCPDVIENCISTSFSHIFSGGYASAYYGYKWAEVLDADAFEMFKEHGIFNKQVAAKFREHVLSKGGTEPAMDLYIRFRGSEPKPDAFLKRSGLI